VRFTEEDMFVAKGVDELRIHRSFSCAYGAPAGPGYLPAVVLDGLLSDSGYTRVTIRHFRSLNAG
jgi:hypothetical protein